MDKKPVGYQFSRKEFSDLKAVGAWAAENVEQYGRAVERGGEFYFVMGDVDESDCNYGEPVNGVRTMFAREVAADAGRKMKTVDIPDVEIFSEGKWYDSKGRVFNATPEMLKDIVEAQKEYRATIKLGHNDGQVLARTDDFPSLGFAENLRLVGKKLIADFKDVPKKIADLIFAKAFSSRSAEVYENQQRVPGGRIYKGVLKAVSLLGEKLPAVNNLDDIVALYAAPDDAARVFIYSADGNEINESHFNDTDNGGVSMSDEKLIRENAELTAKVTTLESKLAEVAVEKSKFSEVEAGKDAEIKALKEAGAKLEKENAELKKFKADAEEQAKKAEETAAEYEAGKFKELLTKKLPPVLHDEPIAAFKAADSAGRKVLTEKYEKLEVPKEFSAEAGDQGGTPPGSGDKKDPEAEIKKFCEANNMDYKNRDDYKRAFAAVVQYEAPKGSMPIDDPK